MFAFSTFIRVKNLLPLLLLLILDSCDDPRDKVPFPVKYTWKDTVLDYRLTHDTLEFSFDKKTKAKRWYFEVELNRGHKVIDYVPPTSFPIKDAKVKIPIQIPDSIPIDSLKTGVYAREDAGNPYSKYKNGYYMPETLIHFIKRSDGRFHKTPGGNNWFIAPDSLLHGRDSIYYQLRLVKFLRDSINRASLPPEDKP